LRGWVFARPTHRTRHLVHPVPALAPLGTLGWALDGQALEDV